MVLSTYAQDHHTTVDRHTLFSLQGGLLLFLAIVLYRVFLERRRRRGDASADWAAASFALAGVGLILQSYRDQGMPPLFSIILGNGIFILFGPFFARAVAKATGARRDYFTLLLLFDLSVVANFCYYTYVQPNVLLRTVEAVGVMGVQYAAIVAILLASRDSVIRPALRAMICFYSVHFGLNLIRLVAVVRLRQADAWFTWFGVVTITGLAMSFVWVEVLRMNHELEARATTDPLTELLNRRGLEQVAEREQRRAHRHSYPCSALSMDINNFKGINDTWGHAAGDQALTALAATLRATLRGTDIAARLGGDEFFVLLPECDSAAAHMAAARIRAALELLRLETFYGETFQIAVSIGVASARGLEVSLPDLMHASDILLYQEKHRHKTDAGAAQVAHAGLPPHATSVTAQAQSLAARAV